MDEVLCPHEFDWTHETALADHELLTMLAVLPLGARVILSIDACHSGDFSRGLSLRGKPRTLTPPAGLRSRGPTVRGFRAAAHAPNITFVSACAPWQTATEATFEGRTNGAFSYFFVGKSANTTLDETITAIEKPLQEFAMTPIADNAAIAFCVQGARTLTAPFRLGNVVRAGTTVFERHWQTNLIGQPVEVDVRITAANGELAAHVLTRAFGAMFTSPAIRIAGNVKTAIDLGLFGVQVVMTVSDWAFSRGAIDFVMQLELANDRAFVPRTRAPVHIDVTQLVSSQRSPAVQRPPPPTESREITVYKDPRVRVVASGIASWGPNWREERIIRPFQDRPRPDGIVRANVPQIGPQRGSGHICVVGWLTSDETDFDFVLQISNHFFGGWGDIDWRVEGTHVDVLPFRRPRSTPTSLANER
jgi:hypothetical protein